MADPFTPRDNEPDERTRVSMPRREAPQPAQPQSQPFGQQAPGQQAPYPAPQQQPQQPAPPQQRQQSPQGYGPYQGAPQVPSQGPGQAAFPGVGAAPRKQPGYFRSLFDFSYENLGAPKFARVFQLLFMIVSGLAAIVGVINFAQRGTVILIFLGVVIIPLVWLLINTLVRLLLEAVVGIVQTAENTEEMLTILRDRGSA